jgi:hypothetical protein
MEGRPCLVAHGMTVLVVLPRELWGPPELWLKVTSMCSLATALALVPPHPPQDVCGLAQFQAQLLSFSTPTVPRGHRCGVGLGEWAVVHPVPCKELA